MGYYRTLSGDAFAGLELYSQASELGYRGSHNFRGWCEWLLGNQEAAIEWAFQNLENDPNNPIHYIDISNSTGTMGLFDESIASAEKALRLNPTFTFAQENRIRYEIFQENYQLALTIAETAVGLHDYQLDRWLGLIQIKLGNYDLALDYLKGYSEELISKNQDAPIAK